MKKYNLVFVCIIFFSCNHNNIRKSFYKTGEIEYLVEYDEIDTSIYKMNIFYQSGQIKKYYNIRKGILNGDMITFYENGVVDTISHWVNGEINGILKKFNNDGSLYQEALYVRGKDLGERTHFRDKNNNKVTLEFRLESDSMKKYCYLFKDNNNNILQQKSYYYSLLNKKDTLCVNNQYKLEFRIFTEGQRSFINHLELGDLNSENRWLHKERNKIIKWTKNEIDPMTITYKFKPTTKGYFLLTGELEIIDIEITGNKTDSIVYGIPVWEDFYVK